MIITMEGIDPVTGQKSQTARTDQIVPTDPIVQTDRTGRIDPTDQCVRRALLIPVFHGLRRQGRLYTDPPVGGCAVGAKPDRFIR